MKQFILLVCGGRDYTDYSRLELELNSLHKQFTITTIVNGGAKGADSLSTQWAKKYKIPYWIFEADWDKHNKAAGPIRNEIMLRMSKPQAVLAFPGGKGTQHMVDLAVKSNCRVDIVMSHLM